MPTPVPSPRDARTAGATDFIDQVPHWVNRPVRDRAGVDIGTLEHIYLSRGSGRPTWGVVDNDGRRHFVPLHQMIRRHGVVRIPVSAVQVVGAPELPAERELDDDTERALAVYYERSAINRSPAPRGRHREGTVPDRDGGPTMDPRSDGTAAPARARREQGSATAVLLILLGIWGALVPPPESFPGYGALDRLLLNVLPGVAILIGGLILGPSDNRHGGRVGAWLALAGGAWLVLGPTVRQLWGRWIPSGPTGAMTVPDVLAQLGYFYGLGALVIALAAAAIGRISARSAEGA